MKKNWKETLVALVFIGSVFMFLSLDIKAAPYVEYKNEYELKEWTIQRLLITYVSGIRQKIIFILKLGP